jgi:hypothetical protein
LLVTSTHRRVIEAARADFHVVATEMHDSGLPPNSKLIMFQITFNEVIFESLSWEATILATLSFGLQPSRGSEIEIV